LELHPPHALAREHEHERVLGLRCGVLRIKFEAVEDD